MDSSSEAKRQLALDETINDKKFIEMCEDIAMQLLKPNLPVISVKKLKNTVLEEIRKR